MTGEVPEIVAAPRSTFRPRTTARLLLAAVGTAWLLVAPAVHGAGKTVGLLYDVTGRGDKSFTSRRYSFLNGAYATRIYDVQASAICSTTSFRYPRGRLSTVDTKKVRKTLSFNRNEHCLPLSAHLWRIAASIACKRAL